MNVFPSLCSVLIGGTIFIHAVEKAHANTGANTDPNKFCCKGKFAELTFNDCQGSYFNTTGCYFLEHFAQYRPCAAICNEVIAASIDEEKCQAYCPDYFDQYCQLCKTQTTPTASSSTTINHLKPLTLSYISIAWISALSLSVVFVGGAICWICVYRRKHNGLEFNCGCKKRSAFQLVLVPGVQESDTMGMEHRLYSPEPSADVDSLFDNSLSCKKSSRYFSVSGTDSEPN